MTTLHQELSEIATTPQLERIAHELKLTQRHLKRNLEVLANFEAKEYKYLILLESIEEEKYLNAWLLRLQITLSKAKRLTKLLN